MANAQTSPAAPETQASAAEQPAAMKPVDTGAAAEPKPVVKPNRNAKPKPAAKTKATTKPKPGAKPKPAVKLKPATEPKPVAAKKAAPAKAAKPQAAAAPKPAKQKLVRDSFTIPRAEYAVLDTLKQRLVQLARPAKKSEVLRAGIKLLATLPDAALLEALGVVPEIKTGRPKKAK
ncbi:hypothetical protein [Aquabacterium sp.]|uniref:hypothetical protein n=1 Tax=Aquabacterium sp. TaxID=1872578 RepID=UPI002C818648|nr:hypothetical protein [Aquabacterium sp.]HSW04093.1 hypothetical protein [Aquabacterium sp.]